MNLNDIFSSILFATSIMVLYIAYFSKKNGKSYISYCLITVAIYGIGYGFEIMRANLSWINFWLRFEYIGIVFLPVAWLSFVLQFTGLKEKFPKNFLWVLSAISICILSIVYTNPWHHLYYKKIFIDHTGPFPIVGIIRGPFYWLDTGYAYIAMAFGVILLLKFYLTAIDVIKKQVFFIILAWILPWIADVIYSIRLIPFHVDLCPLAFCFSGIISSFAIFNFNLIKLTPIAIEKVFQKMEDGVLIFDNQKNIINYNLAAEEIIKRICSNDKNIDFSLKNWEKIPTLKSLVENIENEETLLKVEMTTKEIKYYKMSSAKIYQQDAEKIGFILSFSDVTQLEIARKSQADNYLFLQTILDAIPNPIYAKDKIGNYIQCNRAFSDFLGIDKEDIFSKKAHDLFEHTIADECNLLDKKLINSQMNQVFEAKLLHKDGTYHDIYVSKSAIPSDDGDLTQGIAGIFIDITERKRNEEKIARLTRLKESMLKIGYKINEIQEMNDLLRTILKEVILCIDDKSCGSVLILDDYDMLKIAVSEGFDAVEVKNFKVSLEQHLRWMNRGESIEKTVVCNNLDTNPYIHMLKTKEGRIVKSVISSPIILEGKLYGFLNIGSVEDMVYKELEIELMDYMRNQVANVITKHRLYETTLYLSRYDHLTNIYNRNHFENIFFERTKPDSQNKPFYLVLFDLNDLKHVNDAYGHLAGDATLIKFTNGLQFELSNQDFIGRYGGDEFVGAYFDVTLQELEDRFRELLLDFRKKPVSIDGKKIICSFSYGVSKYPQEGFDFSSLVKLADERMYENKRNRKNSYNYSL